MKTIEANDARIALLRARDVVMNARIIRKLERKKRALLKADN